MPFSLTPRWVFQHYSEITPDWLPPGGGETAANDTTRPCRGR